MNEKKLLENAIALSISKYSIYRNNGDGRECEFDEILAIISEILTEYNSIDERISNLDSIYHCDTSHILKAYIKITDGKINLRNETTKKES